MVPPGVLGHTALVGAALTAERVLRDVEVVARAGLDLDTFVREAVESFSRAVPHVAACVSTVDPSTLLLTGTRKFGDLVGRDERDDEWGVREYGDGEETSFTSLALNEVTAVGMNIVTGGEVRRSPRMAQFMEPLFGYTDELRVVFRDGGQVWGGASLFRDPATGAFEAGDVAAMSALSSAMAVGVRAGILTDVASIAPAAPTGPAVIIVGADNVVQQLSTGAEERLDELRGSDGMADPFSIVTALVGAARRFASGELSTPPRCRVRSRSGMWLVLHASPLTARVGTTGDVVVTIDEARPPEIVPLVVAAFGLSRRERDVTQLVLQGSDTKEISARLHLSTWTVQDHLKAIFDKAGVRSRRDLIARIYFDQYVPRMGTDLGPQGWFAAT
jgi:DNA-binding CsgD family transcriptional regulator